MEVITWSYGGTARLYLPRRNCTSSNLSCPIPSGSVVQELTATGGILIVGIGLNVLGLTKLAVGNMLPAVVVAVLLSLVF